MVISDRCVLLKLNIKATFFCDAIFLNLENKRRI